MSKYLRLNLKYKRKKKGRKPGFRSRAVNIFKSTFGNVGEALCKDFKNSSHINYVCTQDYQALIQSYSCWYWSFKDSYLLCYMVVYF